MIPDQTNCSLYDNLPTLDLWYGHEKSIEQEIQEIQEKKKRTCLVSFSSEPPLIHQYEARPVMERRSSSSESSK
ncbi:hypothetical protein BY458DRAFT_57233 [Sporodiniella umbellata]|nr:hypothetical protein BY458DRAFT_57233 [Sporodiniella umbellata]